MSAFRLTAKQNAFCIAYLEHGNAIRAYREAGYKCDTWTDKMISTEGNALLKNPGISRKIAESRRVATTRAELTLERAIARAEDLSEKAEALGQMGAAVSAATLADKLSGHLVERNLNLGAQEDPVRKMMEGIAGRSRHMPAEVVNGGVTGNTTAESTEDVDPITHVDFTRSGLH